MDPVTQTVSASPHSSPSSASLPPLARLPLLFLGVVALIAGVLSGLARMGLSPSLPDLVAAHAGVHGVLMIPAFLGTVISLERAVALGGRWPFLAPLAAGLGGLSLLAGFPWEIAQGMGIFAALVLTGGSLGLVRRQPALYLATLLIGALCWLVGSVTWSMTNNIPLAAPWWMAFLVLTIAGERLELTRFLPPSPKGKALFLGIIGVALTGLLLAFWWPEEGLRLHAASDVALAFWLWRYDIARRTVKQHGLTRFVALCLLSGYFWLAFGGVLGVAGGFSAQAAGTVLRDAALHAIFLGFVFSMIFGHAPIILPAVARIRIAYHPLFYAPWIALHASLLLRLSADLLWEAKPEIRQIAASFNGIALALFILTILWSVFRSRNPSSKQKG